MSLGRVLTLKGAFTGKAITIRQPIKKRTSTMNIQTPSGAIDLAAIKGRQQIAWGSGDYALIGTTLQIVGESLCEAVDLRSNQRVLDVAAGNGNATLAAARRFADVVSTDYVATLLERGRERAKADRLPVTFQEADAEALPFADQSFDHAWTQHVAMNIADRDALYSSIARVLKPGGRLAIYDVVAGDGSPLLFPVPWARTPEISFLVSAQQMRDALRGAGFVELSSSDKTVAGIAWFEQQMARRVQGPPPALGLDVVLGPEFAQMAANLVSNLKEGRARLLQLLAEKR